MKGPYEIVIDSTDQVIEMTKKEKKKKKKKEKLEKEQQNDHDNIVEEKETKKKKRKRNGDAAINGLDLLNGDATTNEKSVVKETEPSGNDPKTAIKETELSGNETKTAIKEICVSNDDVDESDLNPTQDQREGDFNNFRISESIKQTLIARGITYLFPIQYKTFDFVYDGQDIIAQARTGTGKTLAFALPVVEKLLKASGEQKRGRPPKVIVLTPTRELAKQVCDDFITISSGLQVFCIYGGTPYQPQENAIYKGLDVLVGTPGRIMDHLERGNLDLSKLEYVILDEVDQMLDMGFADSVDTIIKSAYNRASTENPQTLLFSATLPDWVYKTALKYMREDVKRVDLIGSQRVRTATTVQHLAICCSYHDRPVMIGDIIMVYSGNHGRAMVFCQTKKDADELAVSSAIKQDAHVLHGDIPQQKREMVLKGFKDGKYKVLITTDVAARGLDIPEVDLVIVCSPPQDVDSYIHRSGRTGRAGRSGVCVCFYKPFEDWNLNQVEQAAGITFKKITAPSANDIINASARDSMRSLDSVPEETLKHFQSSAEDLIAQRGAVTALAAALAVISGNMKISTRSILSSREGFTTYIFRTNMELRGLTYCWRSLERHIPEKTKETISRMRFCKDKMGCVFDLPSVHDDEVEGCWHDGKYDTLEKATELPELLEESRGVGGGGRGRGGRSFGNRGGNSSRGGAGRGGRFGTFKRNSFPSNGDSRPNKRMKFD